MASSAIVLPSCTAQNTPEHSAYRMADLCAVLEGYLAREQIREVYRAYLFSAAAHDGQFRKSGEPYIVHPVAVARILAEMRLDHKCLMAALLHDIIEDTGVIKEALVREFDAEVAELVDGVSKLTKIGSQNRAEAQAANVSKMLLAMTKDNRIILIKLADRLHNMRTLSALAPQKAQRIAKETLEIYGPIANRLGMNNICLELEDLGFRQCWPLRYRCLKNAVAKKCVPRKEFIAIVKNAIQECLHQENIPGLVVSRQKHLYGIYRKMKDKHRPFSEVVDFYGIRVVVDRLDTCYRTLGLVHNLYKPVHGRFKDFIAIPKANGYQSLHTLVMGPNGVKVEVQIRTEEMHRIAESGIAAHWLYKSPDGHATRAHADWLQNLLEMKRGAKDQVEFLENVKVDLFKDEVYVFTPKGKILVFPPGSTIVDFAYAIHSDIGNACVGGKIDHRLVPLRTRLRSGQTVEILTKPDTHPKPAWLNFVVTGKARSSVRQYLKHQESQEAEELGRCLMQQELQVAGMAWEQTSPERQRILLQGIGVDTVAELWRQIGLGHVLPRLIAWRLNGYTGAMPKEKVAGHFVIKGVAGIIVNFGKCCHPIIGDSIIGTLNPGRGLVVHRHSCHNLGDVRRQGQNLLEIEWDKDACIDLPTEIRVDVGNRRGTLATVATTIANTGSNIENFQFFERDGLSAALNFLVVVRSRDHLAEIIDNLQAIPSVMKVVRVFH